MCWHLSYYYNSLTNILTSRLFPDNINFHSSISHIPIWRSSSYTIIELHGLTRLEHVGPIVQWTVIIECSMSNFYGKQQNPHSLTDWPQSHVLSKLLKHPYIIFLVLLFVRPMIVPQSCSVLLLKYDFCVNVYHTVP